MKIDQWITDKIAADITNDANELAKWKDIARSLASTSVTHEELERQLGLELWHWHSQLDISSLMVRDAAETVSMTTTRACHVCDWVEVARGILRTLGS